MPRFACSKGVRTWRGREASEFPSCRGGDAGEDADARRQIEHPRRDNIITGCFRARMPSFRGFFARKEHAIPSLRSVEKFLSSVSGETGNAIKIKSGKEISLNVEFHVICESLNLQEDPGDCSFILQRIVKISFEDSGRWYSARKRE